MRQNQNFSVSVACCCGFFGQEKKPINTNILDGTVSRTNRNRPWHKRDLSPGQIGTRPWDKPAFFLLDSKVKALFCPVWPWDGWGFVPGTIVPQGPSKKCLRVFCLLVFFRPQLCMPNMLVTKTNAEENQGELLVSH